MQGGWHSGGQEGLRILPAAPVLPPGWRRRRVCVRKGGLRLPDGAGPGVGGLGGGLFRGSCQPAVLSCYFECVADGTAASPGATRPSGEGGRARKEGAWGLCSWSPRIPAACEGGAETETCSREFGFSFFFSFLFFSPTLRGMKTRQIKSSPPPPPDRKRNASRLLAALVWNARWAIKAKKKQVTLDSLRK